MTRFVHSVRPALAGCVLVLVSGCAQAPAPAGPAATAVATAAKPAASTAVAAVSPVATQLAAASPAVATAVAAASPAAATAAAAASPAVGTVVAVASPVASPAAAVAAASPVRITGARLDLSDTTVTVQNVTSSAVDLAGWRLRVGAATAALPSGSRVGPNEVITIHTAAGTSTAQEIYLGQEATALIGGMRPGARVALVDAQGTVVGEFTLPG